MKWVTRARPKIDRLACPWLVQRFVDPEAEFLFVAPESVHETAARTGAIPFDVPGVELTHVGDRCSFDAFLARYALRDEALHRMAGIVRAADTDRLEQAPEAAGLLALSVGLGRIYADEHELLARALVLYDALYAWCAGPPERHGWTPPS